MMKKSLEKFMFWFVWKLPVTLVYFCAVRAAAIATTGKYSNKTPGEVSVLDMLSAFEEGEK